VVGLHCVANEATVSSGCDEHAMASDDNASTPIAFKGVIMISPYQSDRLSISMGFMLLSISATGMIER
ncbi:hypothetical protein OFO93_30160, partial [Escherichia coli]|nr:hypothetical protein [Escherichia coli]